MLKNKDEKIIFWSSLAVKFVFFVLLILKFGEAGFIGGNDSFGYLKLAENIYTNGVFSQSDLAPFRPEVSNTPGYPVILSIVEEPLGTVIPTVVLQIFLFSVTGVLLYRILCGIFPVAVAFWGALIYSVEPWNSFVSNLVLSEAFFMFFFVVGLYLLKKAIDRGPDFWAILGSGLVFSASVITRPILLYFIPFFLIFFIVGRGRSELKKSAVFSLVFMLGFCVFVVPWQSRNLSQFGKFSIGVKGSATIYFFDVQQLLMYRDGIGRDDANKVLLSLVQEDHPKITEIRDLDTPVYNDYLYGKALGIIGQSPFVYFKLRVGALATFLASDGYRLVADHFRLISSPLPNINFLLLRGEFGQLFSYFKSNLFISSIFFGGLFFWALTSLLAFLSVIISFFFEKRKDIFWHNLFFAIIILYFVAVTGLASQARYRVPVTPFLFPMAVYSAYRIALFIGERKKVKLLSCDNSSSGLQGKL